MKLNILFWNYNSKKADTTRSPTQPVEQVSVLVRIVQEFQVHILSLAESSLKSDLVLDKLKEADSKFCLPDNPHEKFQFFTRFPGEQLTALAADDRISVRQLMLPGFRDILLAAIHYYDRWHNSEEKQHLKWAPHRETLRSAEKKVEHGRTILFGDFNMNPYDLGMVDPTIGVGAMMTEDLARLHSEVKGRFTFYNPMWALMGRDNAPGTYYWNSDEPRNPYWNCVDGVLVRPELIGALNERNVQIIRYVKGDDGERSDLIRLKDLHWSIAHSDHLPIMFTLEVPRA